MIVAYVNALNWEPWVYSARYAWWHGNNADNRAKLLKNWNEKMIDLLILFAV